MNELAAALNVELLGGINSGNLKGGLGNLQKAVQEAENKHIPVEPKPVEPKPVEPKPVEPAPVEPYKPINPEVKKPEYIVDLNELAAGITAVDISKIEEAANQAANEVEPATFVPIPAAYQ